MDEQYSEDYAYLLNYKQNVTVDTTMEATRFFWKKYLKLIKTYEKRFLQFGKTASLLHAYTTKIDVEEREGFCRDKSFLKQERRYFNHLMPQYVTRAVEHFTPEKVETKATYSFAPYLDLWLKTGLRDIQRHYKPILIREIPSTKQQNMEESVIEKLDAEIVKKKIAEVMAGLAPIDKQICDALASGKKQNEILIRNETTGRFYSAGYICKRIQLIRVIMEQNGLSL